jgi:hypothetical protein
MWNFFCIPPYKSSYRVRKSLLKSLLHNENVCKINCHMHIKAEGESELKLSSSSKSCCYWNCTLWMHPSQSLHANFIHLIRDGIMDEIWNFHEAHWFSYFFQRGKMNYAGMSVCKTCENSSTGIFLNLCLRLI